MAASDEVPTEPASAVMTRAEFVEMVTPVTNRLSNLAQQQNPQIDCDALYSLIRAAQSVLDQHCPIV